MLACWLMDAWHDATEDDIMFDYVCPAAHSAPVGSNDDDAETSGDEDRDSSRTS